tara:strand:+ start:2367 stop:2600 length:234 start_codon:yes stop_codon:yes gene_type:complete
MKTKRIEKLRLHLQRAMKENGTLHPDHNLSISHDPIYGGFKLAVDAEKITGPYSPSILEIIMEAMITALTREVYDGH